MPREQWDALVRGQGCPACTEVTSGEPANEHGFFVADLDFSRLRLAIASCSATGTSASPMSSASRNGRCSLRT